ncbi:putative two-component system sensor kinase [Pseudonocardia sp. Ae168_Ps1]|uniref:sensor histidine kinase n=1 Tax=unclassified Pseudonocardia TaxID=2619320 RepID=UPI0009678676|nr:MULTISPECIES: histidine kinase [unclassified Pseudonocardia]OLL75851.1 putative two-component system sensor kinase [Pseudonocardia sp. Ae150A_Ps1]OLL81849.1 putative two-component system sensor kinase [Pseudonocardia sp. Ae168_Ps1]OLL84039.1 putative two-component system sensor kinase [Pseudonocardia sp. Ae263_Ps1]OLL95942.1 putative two-component system sensor kinase [Pseudonocardia sp. Ae356_Ps1]
MPADEDSDRGARVPGGRTSLRPRLTGRFRSATTPPSDPAEVLEAGVAVAAGLREPAGSPAATDALRRLAGLCGARSAGLLLPGRAPTWCGPDREAGIALGHRAGARRATDGELTATALGTDPEPPVLVLGGVTTAAARRISAFVADALERARLDDGAAEAEAARLRELRAQISPHFVYNALTTIASFVRSDPARARDLLETFADFIRHSLAARGDYTPLAGEFRSVEAYLTLARAVLGDRLRVQVRVAPEVLPMPIPVLALQPLVENAVQHGVERTQDGGLVQVSGEAEGDVCVIAVEDDGPGMAPEHARAVLAGTAEGAGLALVNVDRRLRAVYGPEHGLVIETAPGAGTRIVLRVPRFQPGVVV